MTSHNATLPTEGTSTASFSSMSIAQDARKYAREHGLEPMAALSEGMQERSEEFVSGGGELYR